MDTLRSRHRLLLYSDGQGPGVSSEVCILQAAEAACSTSFLACPRIFRALLRSLVLRREETTRASSADWCGSEYFRCGERECLRGKPYAVSRLLCKRVDASNVLHRERSILRFDKSAARARTHRVEQQLQPARHYFMVSYVHTSHTTSERASELRDPATWLARMSLRGQ
jgi:hypothetical protein